MASLEHLDTLLGEICELLSESANEIRGIQEMESKTNLRKVGNAIVEMWNIREEIYKISPTMKRDFVVERQQNKIRYETLKKICLAAEENERAGMMDAAYDLYKNLHKQSCFGFFRLRAEAGMYRTERKSDTPTK